MGSDIVSHYGLLSGNSVSHALQCNSETEIKNCYRKLSDGGHADHPLENSFWGALFGDLTHRYRNRWLLNSEKG